MTGFTRVSNGLPHSYVYGCVISYLFGDGRLYFKATNYGRSNEKPKPSSWLYLAGFLNNFQNRLWKAVLSNPVNIYVKFKCSSCIVHVHCYINESKPSQIHSK